MTILHKIDDFLLIIFLFCYFTIKQFENIGIKKGPRRKTKKIAPFHPVEEPSIVLNQTSDITGSDESTSNKRDNSSMHTGGIIYGPHNKLKFPPHTAGERKQPIPVNYTRSKSNGLNDDTCVPIPTSEHRSILHSSSDLVKRHSASDITVNNDISSISSVDPAQRRSVKITESFTRRISRLVDTLSDGIVSVLSKRRNSFSNISGKFKDQDRFDFIDLNQHEKVVKGIYGSYLVIRTAANSDHTRLLNVFNHLPTNKAKRLTMK